MDGFVALAYLAPRRQTLVSDHQEERRREQSRGRVDRNLGKSRGHEFPKASRTKSGEQGRARGEKRREEHS